MPLHRSLTLRKFVESVENSLIERYFTEKLKDVKLPPHIIMNIEAVEKFMGDTRNAVARGLIVQDFRKINDLCEKGSSLIVNAYKKYSIPRDDRLKIQGLAMKLFLDHEEAFDYAYTWYSYYHTSSKVSEHNMLGDFVLTKKKMDDFLKDTRKWFSDLAKGPECIMMHYDEQDTTVILVEHGSYVRTMAYWKDDKIELISFRPASEDILLYKKKENKLSIKASLQKDREQYIKSFSRLIMGDESLAESKDRDTVYSFEPLRNGKFSWSGTDIIKEIILTEIKIEIPGSTEAVVRIRSKDVLKTLEEDIHNISLDSVKIKCVRFRFTIEIDGKKQPVSFMIEPPDVSDLAQKRHEDIISDYLKKQKVKLK